MPAGVSIELTKVTAGVASSDFLAPFEKGGRVRVARGSYTMNNTVAGGGAGSTDTIDLFKLPKGATVVAIICIAGVSHGTAQPTIGDASASAKYRAAATLTTVGASVQNTAAAQVGAAVEGVTIPYTAETTIVLTNTVAAFANTGERVHWICLYVVD
jgi:hypothetical protein